MDDVCNLCNYLASVYNGVMRLAIEFLTTSFLFVIISLSHTNQRCNWVGSIHIFCLTVLVTVLLFVFMCLPNQSCVTS